MRREYLIVAVATVAALVLMVAAIDLAVWLSGPFPQPFHADGRA